MSACSKGPFPPTTCAIGILLIALVPGRDELCRAGITPPPGYEYIRITDSYEADLAPRLNASGDVVFQLQTYGHGAHSDILLYRDGEITAITQDDIEDRYPVIGDDGTIAWSRGIGPVGPYGSTLEIAVWKNGSLDYLTDDDKDDIGPRIASLGHIAWSKGTFQGCDRSNFTPCIFTGTEVVELTQGSWSEQVFGLNDYDEVVWTRYNFCDDPWTSDIMYWDGTELHRLTNGEQFEAQTPDINNRGEIAWHYTDLERGDFFVVIWREGQLTELARGTVPRLNNHGDVFFWSWHDDVGAWQTWAYLRGELYRLTDEPVDSLNGEINDRTDMVWMYGPYPEYDIVMLKRLPFGDMNCDKHVDFDDIDGFVVALVEGKDAFREKFPDCDWWLADMNDDRSIDFNDLDPFIDCLVYGGCER